MWTKNGNYVYLSNTDDNVGIGVTDPDNKLLVKADASTGVDESIFAVLNNAGDTVFAVYPEGVRIWVNDDGGSKATGSRGGFAVGGLNPTKAGFTNEYFRVTPDSVRVYIDDDFIAAKANGSRGGFAVGGFNPAKGTLSDNYLFVQDDSTRVWTNGAGGFEIRDLATSATNYLDLNPLNYFIGHNCGQFTTGNYNAFIGYNSGFSNTTGSENVFLGYQSGANNFTGARNIFLGYMSGVFNTTGGTNVFIGSEAGFSNQTGSYNVYVGNQAGEKSTTSDHVFVGTFAGSENTTGTGNTFLGRSSGQENTTGSGNIFIGNNSGLFNQTSGSNLFIGDYAGRDHTSGNRNTFIGHSTGYNNISGAGNVFIGYEVGYGETGSNKLYIDNSINPTPLIYGDFASNYVYVNGNFKATGILYDSGGDAGVAGQILSSTGVGTNWVNTPASITGSGTATQLAFWTSGSNLSSNSNLYWDNSNSRLGIGTTSPTEALHVNGGIRLGFNTNSFAGTMQWTGADFLGFNGSTWVSLTAQGTVTGTGSATQVAFWNGTSSISGNSNLYWNNGTSNLGIGTASPFYRVHAINSSTSNDDPAIYGTHAVTDNYGIGIRGDGRWRGVQGYSYSASGSASGVYAEAAASGTANGYGIYATVSNTGTGTAYAGYFQGNVHVNGTLSKSAGTFKIDHPLDPENKYLVHSFVESPDMKNVYDGIAVFDNSGKAIVQLPSYFETLNRDFRYQLTTIGSYAPVFIEQEIQNGQFVIAGGTYGMKVSWQVTGIRQDPYAVANPVIVEQNKENNEQGMYLNPELYNQPKSKALNKIKTK